MSAAGWEGLEGGMSCMMSSRSCECSRVGGAGGWDELYDEQQIL